jgi:transcriptional regulator with PAS, ATPase and Fis domain
MFARAIHQASPRRSQKFVAVNCAAISRELLESELFGHVKGAFTGAEGNRAGAFEQADGGTLFLDEIGECDLAMQAKLLRVLQPPPEEGPCKRVFRRVGDTKDMSADVRVIAATNRDLLTAIGEQKFREDLYYRLAVISIKLPPLVERRGDIPQIAERLLAQINRQFSAEEPGYRHKSISGAAIAFVKRHDWPGNVRQLFNALMQAAVMSGSDEIQRQDIEAALGEIPPGGSVETNMLERPLGDGFDLVKHLNEIQRHYLQRAMTEANGVKSHAARLLGIPNYQTLAEQLKRLNVTGNWKRNGGE